MARIPNNELDRLKNEVSLVRLVESQGYAVPNRAKTMMRPRPIPRR